MFKWQSFEAANGRVARAAARVVLRAAGLDAQGVAAVDVLLAQDPMGVRHDGKNK